MVENSPFEPPQGGSRSDPSRREMLRGALAAGGFGAALTWNRPLVAKVLGGVSHPSTCQCTGSMPPTPLCKADGTCTNYQQAITRGGSGVCAGSMCGTCGTHCHYQSQWTCVSGAWRRDTLTAVGCG